MSHQLTNFPNGLSSFGVPVLSHIPFGKNSKVFFVDPANGSNSNSGLDPAHPLDTVSNAHGRCVAGRNDVVMLIGDGSTTGTSREDAAVTWSKNSTHLIGVGSPVKGWNRARLAPTATTTAFANFFTLSASGCIFANIAMFHGFNTGTTSQICLTVTGHRNYFYRCHIAGAGDAESANSTGSASLKLNDADENLFEECTIGINTQSRTAAMSEVIITGQSQRNKFIRCDFETFAGTAGVLFVNAATASSDIDRYALFEECNFINPVESTATTMTAAISTHAALSGMIILKQCMLIGATYWVGADTAKVKILAQNQAAGTTTQTAGLAASADLA